MSTIPVTTNLTKLKMESVAHGYYIDGHTSITPKINKIESLLVTADNTHAWLIWYFTTIFNNRYSRPLCSTWKYRESTQ